MPNIDQGLLDLGHELLLFDEAVTEDELIDAMADTDLLLMCYTSITRRIIEAAPKLKGIVKYGVGIDAIDIEAAKEHRVIVVNVPEYAEETVAEGAFTLMIALAKKLIPLDQQMKKHGWAWPEPQWMGADIAGKTVGLIGYGKIGKSMARMAGQGFRARVIAYSPNNSAKDMSELGVEKVDDLLQLMQDSDFVSIHCVLNPDTQQLVGERELRAMKPSAFLINVSRGAIVDEVALVKVLNEGAIAGAGLDVYGQEPLDLSNHPMASLFEHPNVILSPHVTFYTQEAMVRLETETMERCVEILQNQAVTIKSTDIRLEKQAGLAIYDD
ncbi:MAG: C-terminal binding protein [Granulosicoccaceae bacterium]